MKKGIVFAPPTEYMVYLPEYEEKYQSTGTLRTRVLVYYVPEYIIHFNFLVSGF